MKKNYIAPNVEVANVELQQMVAASNGVYSDNGLGWGGFDKDGEKEPNSRYRNSLWDDDDDYDF